MATGSLAPYGEGASFWALGEIVKAQAGILESDPADVTEKSSRKPSRTSRTRTSVRGSNGTCVH